MDNASGRKCLPVNKGVPHGGGDGAGLCLAQSEDALDDRQLCACGVQPAERTPVIHHHTASYDLTTPVNCPCLQKEDHVKRVC